MVLKIYYFTECNVLYGPLAIETAVETMKIICLKCTFVNWDFRTAG